MSDKYKYDILVMIGDFAPFHFGYSEQLKEALTLAENVIVIVNNAHIPRNIETPWTYPERYEMIAHAIYDLGIDGDRVSISPVFNYLYSKEIWIAEVQGIVTCPMMNPYPMNIGIFTHDGDLSDMFPQWTWEHPTYRREEEKDTNKKIEGWLRTMLLGNKSLLGMDVWFTPHTFDIIYRWFNSTVFMDLVKEYEFIKNYKAGWASAPYPPTFVTADSVVVQSGHILMIVRDSFPGQGLLALPGGFLDLVKDDTLEDAALRELEEETKINCPKKVLRGNIVESKVFSHRNRSLRGRTVTEAFFIRLPDGPLPKVKGSDDARKAVWVPFNKINSNDIFEDHYSIIRYWIK